MKTSKGKKKFVIQANSGVKHKNLGFKVGDEVLACWQDGLHYLAVVKSIDEAQSKCHVSFQDGSVYLISLKNIRTNPEHDDISCTKCGKRESKDHNQIIICDRCSHGYHQDCHIPVVDDKCVAEPGEWFCRICVFSTAAKSGGAMKSGPEANALMAMKQVLPYNISSLSWDAHHKSNTSETYCYCGGPGVWYYKMLECYNCRQWFHEACLQCLDYPLLLGDRFYYFLCTLCNNGKEYIKRIQLKWPAIAQLLMYNISLKYDKKYFNVNEIKSFVKSNWDALQTLKLHSTAEDERMEKITEVFSQQKHKYRTHSMRGPIVWSLIVCATPCPSKPTYLREHRLKVKSEMGYQVLDCNGNYLPEGYGSKIEGLHSANSPSQRGVSVQDRSTADTSKEIDYFHTPLFPSPSMFKYFLPSSARRSLENGSTLSPAFGSDFHGGRNNSEGSPTAGDKRNRPTSSDVNEPIEKRFVDYVQRFNNDITSYEGSLGRLACGEECSIRGRRLSKDGRTDYLVEWSGTTPDEYSC